MHIILQRLTTSKEGTYGVLLINGRPYFTTLELPWKDNLRNISCIPPGMYKAKRMYSEKFKKIVFVLENVPDRDLIEIHIGNKIEDTEGCILLGTEYNVMSVGIVNSRAAFSDFMIMMPNELTISINDIVVREGAVWV